MSKPIEQLCAKCGAELASFAAEGFCSACLLERGLNAPDARSAAATERVPSASSEIPGDWIDRYMLLQKIGEGGCGVVYMAEQTEPVRRRVALKVIKLGMDTRQVIGRFEAERQALALMDHPNIAKVFDAGATATGRPYFVMELVKGIRITDYCDQDHLSTRQRLDLFTQVCQAIQHAHQKGIIHRDIKPSNILVTLHDGVPVPKVIDFGIAKATEQPLTEKTVFTALGQFMGTPAYMSPEQAELSGLDIDTRSDIYALGVLLYELLTGRTPFDAKELWQAGLDEMRRRIREEEPVRPSTRLSTMTNVDLTQVAQHRQSEPGKLTRFLRGDLDWIVMKCLEKDRTRRYETANGLATDLRRHLDNEPVLACPPSAAYRFQKLVRRNKLGFAAVSAVAAALVIGLGIAAWQVVEKTKAYNRAIAAEKQSRDEASKSQQVAQFLKDMLKSVGPSAALGRDTKMLREILDKTAERVSHDLTNQPAVEAELRVTIGLVYTELGEYAKAEAMHRRALELRRKLFGNEHLDVAQALNRLAAALENQAKHAEAEPLAREALAIQRTLLGPEHVDVAWSLNSLGIQLMGQGKEAEAEPLAREALAMRRKLLGNDHRDVANSLNNLGNYKIENSPAEAEPIFREALAILKRLFGDAHPDMEIPLDNLAIALIKQRKFPESEPVAREALALKLNMLGRDHPHVQRSLGILALTLEGQGKQEEAVGLAREQLSILRRTRAAEDLEVANSLNALANRLTKQSKLSEAESLAREALAIQRKLCSNDFPALVTTLGGLCGTLDRLGKWADEEPLLRELLAMQQKLLGHDDRKVASTIGWLSRVVERQGKLTEVERLVREQLTIQQNIHGNEHTNVLSSTERLSNLLEKQGKLDEAEPLKREALAIRKKVQGADHLDVASACSALAWLLQREGKLEEAGQRMRECLIIREMRQPGEWRTFKTRSNLGLILLEQKKYADAEPLLVSGCNGMTPGADTVSASDAKQFKETLQSLAQLYETTDRPVPAAEWRQKLVEFEKLAAEKKSSPAPPNP